MLRRALLTLTLCLPFVWPGGAAMAEDTVVDRMADVLGLPDLVAIMHEEGTSYGAGLREELFPGTSAVRWEAEVDAIYDIDRMEAVVRRALARDITEADAETVIAFFDGPLGRRVVELELSARRALLDEDVEAASRTALEARRADDDPLLDRLEAFILVNDLIESNVVGALNSNIAFYRGLAEGGAFPDGLTETDILEDVWRQEPEIREETVTWLYSYLGMAYDPLAPEDLEAYTAFSASPEGRRLNRALFAGFDELFNAISLALGRAAGQYIGGQDL
ncbi:MAG: DUF2059 domain-containing protein [Paracoccaceae bacterium]